VDLLATYGYEVRASGGDREQQFSCDLHGDGTDSKPSARVYPESGHWYCFACATSRDAIQTVREKEGLDFAAACALLERRFNLPTLPWSDDNDSPTNELSASLEAPVPTVLDAQRRVSSLLKALTEERSLSLHETLVFWEQYDRVSFAMSKGVEGASEAFLKLRDRLVQAVGHQAAA